MSNGINVTQNGEADERPGDAEQAFYERLKPAYMKQAFTDTMKAHGVDATEKIGESEKLSYDDTVIAFSEMFQAVQAVSGRGKERFSMLLGHWMLAHYASPDMIFPEGAKGDIDTYRAFFDTFVEKLGINLQHIDIKNLTLTPQTLAATGEIPAVTVEAKEATRRGGATAGFAIAGPPFVEV